MTTEKLIERMADDVSGLRAEVGAVQTTVAGISAKLDAATDRHETEIAALFVAKDEHAQRISVIERSYTPRDVHEKLCEEVRDIRASRDRGAGMGNIVSLIVQVVGLSGIAALLLKSGGGH